MTKKDIKKLTPAVLKKEDKKLDDVQEFLVTIGENDYLVTHDVVFRKSKMHKVLDDMVVFFNEAGKKHIEFLELASPYSALLILKHFTSLEVSDDVDEAMDLLNVLVDLESLDKLLNALPEDEVVKVFEMIKITLDNFTDNLKKSEEEASEIALENAEILGVEIDGEQDTPIESE